MRPWHAALLLGLALPVPGGLVLPVPGLAQPVVQARPAAAFLDSIGVNTHLTSEWDTAYGDCANAGRAAPPCPHSVARIAAALRMIGVHHIRDGFPAAYVAPRFRALADAVPGLRIDSVVSGDRHGPLAQQLAFSYPDADLIDYVEGPNEPNNRYQPPFHYNGHPFPAGVTEAMHDLRALLRHGPLAHARLIDVALGGGTDADVARLGVVTEAEFANAHAYYGVRPPRHFTEGLTPARKNAPGKPMIITETGNCTPEIRTDWCAVTEAVQARYTLMALADAFDSGVVRTYLYELVDEQPDPTGADIERHFGLFHTDWSPKPAGQALANLQGELGGGQMAGKSPGRLAFSLPDARTVLLRRGDGTDLIIAWFDAELWDRDRHDAIRVTARPVTLIFATLPAGVAVFDPLDASRQTLAAATTIRLELPDHPVVIEVKSR